MIALNRRRYMGGGGGEPYDYEAEYLHSDGNQYFILPIHANSITDAIEMDIRPDSDRSGARFCCSTDDNENTFSVYYASSHLAYYNNGGQRTASATNRSTRVYMERHNFKVDYKNNLITFDFGKTFSKAGGDADVSQTGYLSLIRKFGTTNAFIGRIYSCKFWRNDVLVYDLIPVIKDNVGYMYDKVQRKLYANQGTGNFTFTQKNYVETVVPSVQGLYVTNGLIALYDGINNAGYGKHSTEGIWVDLVGGLKALAPDTTSWDNNCVVLDKNTNKSISFPSYYGDAKTIEIVYKVDDTQNTQYKEAAVLTGLFGYGLYNQVGSNIFFTDNSHTTTSNKRYIAPYDAPYGTKTVVSYIKGTTTANDTTGWKCYVNGEQKTINYGGSGIATYGPGIQIRADRKFTGNVYCIRIYDRELTAQEILANQAIDNTRFNLGLTFE